MTRLRRDDWLSKILGCDVWSVDVALGGPDAPSALAINALEAPAVLYAKVPTVDVRAVMTLGDLGFRVVDTNVTLERGSHLLLSESQTQICRFATPMDCKAVQTIAARSFRYSRLHLDPDVSQDIADRSRAEWAGNFFAGQRGDHMVIAEVDGVSAGFLQLLGPKSGVLTIDLIGVDRDYRRRGLARAMIAFAMTRLTGFETVRVGTQIANVSSLRFYEALGFRVTDTNYVLHCRKH
jgi:ribosomal protein S18 acetylase RimI-like enzyme